MANYDLIIKGGTVITESDSYTADVAVKDGKVVCIGESLDGADNIYDAAGKMVMPGGIDIHTHLDTPLNGSHTLDDWYEGTVSAACGGVTCVVDYPMQEKGHSVREVLEKWHSHAEGKAVIDFGFSPVITQRTEESYAEIPKLIEDGYSTMKVFMAYWHRIDDLELIRLLDIVNENGGLLGIHCENDKAIEYLAEKLVAEGKTEPKYHPVSRPVSAEVDATERAIHLADMVEGNVFIVHMSSEEAVDKVRQARRKKNNVYAETCTHYLLLEDYVYDQPLEEAAKYVITPPIRKSSDREGLWAAINSGDIHIVSSDHCAFPMKDKLRLGQGDFTKIPHGAPGVEARVPVVFSEGVSKGRITPQKFVEIISTNPARIAGLYPQKGTLAVGSDADIMILDPEKEVTLSLSTMHNPSDFTPYEGVKVKGFPIATISRGSFIWKDGKVVGQKGHGKFVKRHRFQPF